MNDPSHALAVEFLGELENCEASLLSWGLVDGFWSEEELLARADGFLTKREAWHSIPDGMSLLNLLEQEHFIIRWDGPNGCRYRTRMAESLRMMSRLRQLFPKHLRTPGAWVASPALVSDFRFLPKPRKYPHRDIDATQFIEDLGGRLDGVQISTMQRAVALSILGIENSASKQVFLSGFQTRSVERILQCATNGIKARPGAIEELSGTIVSSGTGSGKTLGFYLPTLVHIAGMLERNAEFWTRALAIYPRNELLKDQFSEVCARLCRVNPTLRKYHKRGIRIGAYFGDTPNDNTQLNAKADRKTNWERQGNGWVCPIVRCIVSGCDGRMVWRDADQKIGVERLFCDRCNNEIDDNTVVLTRKRMRDQPPDILFTSTEMLNQRMTDSRSWHLFGIGQRAPVDKKPAFVLLDEVHTYVGSSGAQVALLLRRWRHRANCAPHFAGLSATLMEAAPFFSQLTGVPESRVEQISPEDTEMMEEGREYLVALRGDPASGASLLSTTIQVAMLWRRVLDIGPQVAIPNGEHSGGSFGRKAFVFTDDLDVTNRLFFNLLDAEGLDHLGRPDFNRHPEGSLANLRTGNLPERDRRWLYGQWWRLCEEIGHSLQPGNALRIGRVSSQDSGVDSDAELIVATAALEVGFNDPDVGAVIQHKSPREAASFLQRRGRAGRRREIRPWTLVVLSDFGRDRLAYQGYDTLFDPELRPRRLPLANRHILKMQAAYSCLDWIADQLSINTSGHVWAEASGPVDFEPSRRRQEAGANLLRDVLSCGDSLSRLQDWLRRALRLSSSVEVDALLWESPRSLMAEVLPTLLRRWENAWQADRPGVVEHHASWHPLPEFVPANLFSDLNLPEVTIYACLRPGEEPEQFPLPAGQAIREFAPGRISRRFGIRHRLSRHWIPLTLDGQLEQDINIDSFCPTSEREDLGSFHIRLDNGETQAIRVLRPLGIHVRHDAPPDVQDSSNATPIWHSQLVPPQSPGNLGIVVNLPVNSPWKNLLEDLRFFTHRERQPISIRRFTSGSQASIRRADGSSTDVVARFVCPIQDGNASEPVALGFSFEADALRVRVKVPQNWKIVGQEVSPEKLRSLRLQRFRWKIDTDPRLNRIANRFQRQWLEEIVIAALATVGVQSQQSLEASWAAITNGNAEVALTDVLGVIFQSLPTAPQNDDDSQAQLEQKRIAELRDLICDPVVIEVVNDSVKTLWENPNSDWNAWLGDKFLATVAAAFREAVQHLCPEENVDSDLVVDLGCGPSTPGAVNYSPVEGCADFWITETSPGGGGLIEHLLPKIVEDVRRFLDLVEGALEASDYEFADGELRRFLGLASEPTSSICKQVELVREAQSQEQLTARFNALKSHLGKIGIQTSHSVMAALSARVLRPGSSVATDELLRGLLDRWKFEENRLGIDVELRSLAYALSFEDSVDQALASGGALPFGPGQDRQQWRCNALSSMLWPRGEQARNHSLSLWNPYSSMPNTERWLVCDELDHTEETVHFGDSEWMESLALALQRGGRAILRTDTSNLESFREALLGLLATPVDTGTLLLYPRLRSARRASGEISVIFELTAPSLMGPPASSDPTTNSSARIIVKTSQGSREEIRDLLESLFVAELMAPGPEIWLVSPWVSDLELLDNRSGAYSALDPHWPKRHITLVELLAFALKANTTTKVNVVTRPDSHNLRFCERLRRLAELDGTNQRLSIARDKEKLHSKGLIGSAFAMNGSMNFTRNGVAIFDETVQFETAPERLAELRVNFHHNYPFSPQS